MQVYRGKLYLKQNKLDEAQVDFSKAIEIDGHKFSGYIGLGDCHRAKGDFKSAVKYYSMVVDQETNLIEIIGVKRVWCHLELKEYQAALADVERVGLP